MAAWSAGQDPRAIELFDDHPPAFDPDVLAVVRQRLTTGGNAPIYLVQLLGNWGPAAGDAVPEILSAYQYASGVAAGALAAIGQAALPAVPGLRDRALAGDVRAGHAVWHLTGDADPLVRAITVHLAKCRRGLAWDLRLASGAGTALAPLASQLQGWLADTGRFHAEDRLALAELLWRATGDQTEALSTVTTVLDIDRASTPAGAAARLAAALAPTPASAGPNLAPGLWRQLTEGSRWSRPDAARALWHLGTPVTELVEPLLAAAADPYGEAEAVTLLAEMGAVTAVPGLVELAERDERVVNSGHGDYVWRDDELRHHARAAVTTLLTTSAAAPTVLLP